MRSPKPQNPARGRSTPISNEQVQRLKLRLGDRSPKPVNNVLSVLNVLLRRAVECDVLERTPCSIRLTRVPHTDAAFHDFGAYERLLVGAQEFMRP